MVHRRKSRVVVQMRQKESVKKPAGKAKAAEISALGKVLRLAGSAGGGALGAYLGNPVLGASAGNQLGALASRWLGFGDYAVNSNSIISKSTASVPSMHADGQSIIVRHKEFVGQIVSSTAFTVQYELPLNPGMESVFPWLSGVARRYQEYSLKGVVFHYVPTSGSAIYGTSPSLGSVMIQTTYRSSDGPPNDKVEMLNEYCASEAVPSEPFIHPIECDPKENPFNIHYVRNAAPPSGEPLMSYDLGRTFVATQGQLAAGNVIGDLWVTYEVELKKPLIRSDVVTFGIMKQYYTGGGTVPTLFNTRTASSGPAYATGSGAVLTFPKGVGKRFSFVLQFYDSSLSAFNCPANPVATNCTFEATGVGNVIGFSYVTGGAGTAVVFGNVYINDPANDATLDFTSAITKTGTLGTTFLQVARVN